MTRVLAEQSISLDGFSAGSNNGPANPKGDGGQRLYEWLFSGAEVLDANIPGEYWSRVGAVILGKRMFDNGLESWDGDNPWDVPAIVLTHERREPLSKNGDIKFTFVGDGIESVLARARDWAGDKDIAITGGANTIRQFLKSGLLDEIHVHIVPIFLGDGNSLFDQLGLSHIKLEPVRAIGSSAVAHLEYRIVR